MYGWWKRSLSSWFRVVKRLEHCTNRGRSLTLLDRRKEAAVDGDIRAWLCGQYHPKAHSISLGRIFGWHKWIPWPSVAMTTWAASFFLFQNARRQRKSNTASCRSWARKLSNGQKGFSFIASLSAAGTFRALLIATPCRLAASPPPPSSFCVYLRLWWTGWGWTQTTLSSRSSVYEVCGWRCVMANTSGMEDETGRLWMTKLQQQVAFVAATISMNDNVPPLA